MEPYSLYIVDDEQSLARGIAISLQKDYQTKFFLTAETALNAMKKEVPDLVLLDIGLPKMNGIDALREIKEEYPDVVVIMITAFEDIKTVISAMRLGAYDYVVKPLQMDGLEVTIKHGLESIRLKKEVQSLQEKYLKENLPFFIGESKVIQDVMHYIETVAKSPDTPILILGESGTGKELIASAIHFRSPNFQGKLIPVNCAAIPKDLLESELFGYEKGAFSGAHSSGKKGLIEQAADGTLFLDEIGDLDLAAQAKLLRFLESGEFYKVGGTKIVHVQTRVVSATNKNLEKMIDEGTFREDLFFRIGVIKLEIPSLNKRPEDILPIAKHFLVEFNNKFGKSLTGMTPRAEQELQHIQWRGNIRELRNIIERATLIAKGPQLTLEDLGGQHICSDQNVQHQPDQLTVTLPEEGIDLPSLLASIEKEYIAAALRLTGANETSAAKLLRVKYSTLRYRRRILNIP
ncbi:sigma-54-dependent Fis family transcriptional regulator [Desulfopila sp. IMCC35006]|uniref:sigma-54-dependent transcriptional regulator n=1 Tax=Desulfopila sp. IMCC35006 TaxID=2569542 RepID=UPI0010AC40DE|nr:sigma-54 dependent transcriptional regulator [Desulfopila sp. IMCC35006]TKB27416.1 sigma-54-dependent Fis family transcriptional regulator [Desulfopila sp. IMCC35006]